MRRILLGTIAAIAIAGSAHAGAVIVNGKTLDYQERLMLSRTACFTIPPGNYWLNTNTGYWGYAGSARVQGHIYDACRTKGKRRSLSERGLLWRPGELVTD